MTPAVRASSGAVIATSEDRLINADYVVAVAVRFEPKDTWVVELDLADGTRATRGCHRYRQTAEQQRDQLLDALGWRVV